ncbi:MAG: DsrE family protein [Thiobacillus sp.]|nr:DsrE family protein [Thiobacillus sp.]
MKFINKLMGAVLGGAMVLGAIALPTTAVARDAAVTPKLVIQVSDSAPANWSLALNNAKNVQKDLKGAVIEIVAYGPGIGMLKADSVVANRIGEAADSGIKVVACENTMRGQKLTKEDMNSKISYVQAGVVEIMDRQAEGYAYIRP